ncbi:hypothetical protein I3J27_35180 [Bradyrhizobium xenonodulans]|uniref:NadR/Ttd14 AAA domain-containing protein n=1 Tax=Bradyrhizobium xenonodulans TaxID=2736875 RepID=A0ABY7ML75_9BRAD|nr:hypothetical protein [Bradyrhizobium xenonodulans]WBL78132.1 hypothetical protein I3J27_35180 [Bradyrhizobium xenonodulans]
MWLISECMRQEAAASLKNDVILVDRPVCDALCYLRAALQLSGRRIPPRRIEALSSIVEAHTPDYDILIATELDGNIPLGPGRDTDDELRQLAAENIRALISKIAPAASTMSYANRNDILVRTLDETSRILRNAFSE